MALAASAKNGQDVGTKDPYESYTVPAGEVSFGVLSGGDGGSAGIKLPERKCPEEVPPAGQVSVGVRSGGGPGGEQGIIGETLEAMELETRVEEPQGEMRATEQIDTREEGDSPAVVEDMGWPEYPWWTVVADAIETALNSMTLDELNERMAVSVVFISLSIVHVFFRNRWISLLFSPPFCPLMSPFASVLFFCIRS